jgi:hypothetical protein
MRVKRWRHEATNPVTYDNLSRGNRGAVKWGPLEEGDIAAISPSL